MDFLDLLHRTTSILLQAASYYGRNNKHAVDARQKVNALEPGCRPFHAAMYERLSTLNECIQARRPTNDLGTAEVAVRQTLDTFEALVRAKVDIQSAKPGESSPYEGLLVLQSMFEADANTRRRLRGLGYRKFLYCPGRHMCRRLREDVKNCSDALHRSSEMGAGSGIAAELEHIREWHVPAGLRDHAIRARNILARHWNCDCVERHSDVKLAFTALPVGDDLDVQGCYTLYWPLPKQAEEHSSMPLLHLIRTPGREVEADGASPASASKKNVRFFEAGDKAAVSIRRRPEQMRMFSTMCDAIASNHGKCVLRADEDSLHTISLTHSAFGDTELPIQSLRGLLTPGKPCKVPRKQRIIIAIALAYAYLHLSDTAWWPKAEVLPDFWFIKDPGREYLRAGLPFLSVNIDGGTKSGHSSIEGYINPVRPSLPAFGKLLLEVWKGEPVKWGDDLDATVAECEEDPIGEYWLCAVNACLGKENVLKEDGTFRESTRLRSLFVQRVIKSLQWLFEKCAGSSAELIFPAPNPLGSVQLGSRTAQQPDVVAPISTNQISTDLKNLCLHDDPADWEPYDQKNQEAAGVWLAQLRSEVHPFFEVGYDPVKVAIIDTGAFFNRRTQLLHQGRVREIRSFVHEQDGECGISCPSGEDTDGHGTHATSVFMDIDPFSEVYVAKVFHKREQKQGKTLEQTLQLGVARAIKYAVQMWKVQVISLSFGFERQVDIIRSAILAAESSNVIVLVAASNSGGNKPLSWPAREPTVFNIYATNGYGNSYERNPTQRRHDDNFAVLGSCVKGWWNSGEKVVRSGTSIATPIAAGLASLTIHFLRQHRRQLAQRRVPTDEDLDELCQRISTYAGMRRIFRRMVNPDNGDRGGYCYVEPWRLFDRHLSRDTIYDFILSELRQV